MYRVHKVTGARDGGAPRWDVLQAMPVSIGESCAQQPDALPASNCTQSLPR
jgi:hypothetical protein